MAVRLKTYLGSVLLLILAVGWVSGEYLGCYEDKKGRSRLMPDHVTYFNDINTPRRCTYLCTRLGYRYAGVEDGHLCFCSELEPSVNKKLVEAECSRPCPGDNKEFCGGPLRLSVYSGNVNPPSNAVYMGCYEDTGTRLLADNRFELHEINTPKKCINLCKSFGFPYAGIEVGVQCFCSKQRPSDDQKKPDAECNYFCPYTKHKCGGIWRLTVFTYQVDKATLLDISDDTVEKTYLGCFEDNGKRLLPEYWVDFFEINTPKKCIYICKQLGYNYAGVQNGNECQCGNEKPSSDLKRGEGECDAACPYREQKCGGASRLTVYSIDEIKFNGYQDSIHYAI